MFDGRTGAFVKVDGYVDRPLVHRIHSGEAFGDGGLVVDMFWGTGFAFLGFSGIIIYVAMRRRNPKGCQRVFW